MKITVANRGTQTKPSYGWVVVAAGALMACVAFGAVFSLAVFLQPIAQATGWSRAGVSGAMTLDFLAMGVGGFVWGALSDRYGARAVVLMGSVLLGLGLVLASRATSLFEFTLVCSSGSRPGASCRRSSRWSPTGSTVSVRSPYRWSRAGSAWHR
jgi:MFS family permease